MAADVSVVRKELIKNTRLIVVKAGTRLLTDPRRFSELIAGIAALREKNYKVMLISSGAVGTGMTALGLEKRPKQLSEVQALASIGQGKLMALYDAECRKYGFHTAQLLLTADDLRQRSRYINAANCINALLCHDVLPIINENDSVSVAELKFGDNDTLAGMLGAVLGAELTVILTTEQGLRKRNADGTLGERISLVEKLTPEMIASAGDTDNNAMSVGGMISKLRAANLVTEAGSYLWIADGREPGILEKIVAGEDVGPLFCPRRSKLHSKQCWIKFFAKASGSLTLDAGAIKAVKSGGKSLLPSGVTGVFGSFKRGDTVELCTAKGEVIARGLSNYSSSECAELMGKHHDELVELLGSAADEEFVHRDNLVLAPELKGLIK